MSDDETGPALLPVLRERWSPRAFDPHHELSADDVALLLEAARWAPSAGNSQPWAFHATRRGTADWERCVPFLAASSRPWAACAALLVVNLARTRVEGTDWEYSEFAHYDLGQAVAHLTVQAHAMGLHCRQFRAFDKDGLTAALAVPPHWEIVTMTAVGRAAASAARGPRASSRRTDVAWPPSAPR